MCLPEAEGVSAKSLGTAFGDLSSCYWNLWTVKVDSGPAYGETTKQAIHFQHPLYSEAFLSSQWPKLVKKVYRPFQ